MTFVITYKWRQLGKCMTKRVFPLPQPPIISCPDSTDPFPPWHRQWHQSAATFCSGVDYQPNLRVWQWTPSPTVSSVSRPTQRGKCKEGATNVRSPWGREEAEPDTWRQKEPRAWGLGQQDTDRFTSSIHAWECCHRLEQGVKLWPVGQIWPQVSL